MFLQLCYTADKVQRVEKIDGVKRDVARRHKLASDNE